MVSAVWLKKCSCLKLIRYTAIEEEVVNSRDALQRIAAAEEAGFARLCGLQFAGHLC